MGASLVRCGLPERFLRRKLSSRHPGVAERAGLERNHNRKKVPPAVLNEKFTQIGAEANAGSRAEQKKAINSRSKSRGRRYTKNAPKSLLNLGAFTWREGRSTHLQFARWGKRSPRTLPGSDEAPHRGRGRATMDTRNRLRGRLLARRG